MYPPFENAKTRAAILYIYIVVHKVIIHNSSITVQTIVNNVTAAHYGSMGCRGTKLEIFLPKNQHTQRKLLNFENLTNGEPQ